MNKAEIAGWKALAGQMQALQASPGWQEYRKQLEEMENRTLEAMVTGDRDGFDRAKGFIEGLRACFHLPGQLIAMAGQLDDENP